MTLKIKDVSAIYMDHKLKTHGKLLSKRRREVIGQT